MRISAVRYINALPLIYGLQDEPSVTLTFETPSVCYRKLISREADVGLIPVIGTQMDPSLRAIKGLGIAANTRSESVFVFSKKPLDLVRSVAADSASMTSVTLLKIILKEKYGNVPEFHSNLIYNIHDLLRNHDAALVIGDEAILIEKTDYDHYDLASEWYSLTGFPFVFAFWASNRPLTEDENQILRRAYERATGNWDAIYSMAQETLPVDSAFLKRYYTDDLHYHLARSDYEGLLRFFTLASECGLIDRIRKDIWA